MQETFRVEDATCEDDDSDVGPPSGKGKAKARSKKKRNGNIMEVGFDICMK